MGNVCCCGDEEPTSVNIPPPPTVYPPQTQIAQPVVTQNYGWNVGNSDSPHSETGSSTYLAPGEYEGGMPTPMPSSGYSWANGSYGAVPHNAVRAGVDKNGEPIYIGRAFHEGDIVPAKIVQSHGGAYIPWGGAEHKKEHYEVICAENVTWMSDSNGAVPDSAVSIGTTQEGEKLFLGRVMHDGTLTPGKIHPSHGVCYIPYGGQEISYPEYEVLIIY